MPSVTNSVESIIGSIINAITSVFTGILAIFQHILNIFIGVFQTTFSAVGQAISGLAQTFQGLLRFLLSKLFSSASDSHKSDFVCTEEELALTEIGNILIIGVFVAALFLYGVYQQRTQGTGRVGTQKKTI